MSDPISVTCPHCGSGLLVDIEAGVVVDHTPPATTTEKTDFDTRLKQIEEEKERASDRMAEAMRMEKSKERIMEDRFRKLLDDAKQADDDEPPIRDIDLD
jgi:predicted  nucleic acid-binding Zn-ribbon protein